MTFWTRAQLFPPVLCRLLARKKWSRPLTVQEIAERGKLHPHQVVVISEQTSWAHIDVPTMKQFLDGCGLDFEDTRAMNRVDHYLGRDRRRQPKFTYLKRSPDYDTLYKPMIRSWLNNLKT